MSFRKVLFSYFVRRYSATSCPGSGLSAVSKLGMALVVGIMVPQLLRKYVKSSKSSRKCGSLRRICSSIAVSYVSSTNTMTLLLGDTVSNEPCVT